MSSRFGFLDRHECSFYVSSTATPVLGHPSPATRASSLRSHVGTRIARGIERAARASIDTIAGNEGRTIPTVTQTAPIRASL